MQKFSKLNEVRIKDVKAKGWLREFLNCQADGIVGHLHEIGYPFDKSCWQYKSLTEGGYAQWWPYEQTGYWIDSVVRTAAFTDNQKLMDTVMGQIEKSLSYQDAYIGPKELEPAARCSRWPHAVYFRALYALWSYTGNVSYLEKMRDHYLQDTPAHYATLRNVVNVETILRLYEYFGDERLFSLAKDGYDQFNADAGVTSVDGLMSDEPPQIHGVSYNEEAKLAAIMYIYTGQRQYLDAVVNAFRKIEEYHMLPDGMHSCSEGFCGSESWRTHESCDISDHTWALGYLLEATGKAKYADQIERICFNALPGATGHYFKTIQYLSCVNQVLCTRNSTHIEAWYNTPRMAYQPHHYPECCVSNIGRAMPNYVLRMYQKTEDGICASLYGDSVYDDGEIRLEQSGGYPFSSRTMFTVHTTAEKKLMLRIPAWTRGYSLKVNGKETYSEENNGYISLKVADGDQIVLVFRMALSMHCSCDNGVYYNYGPFLMTLKIDSEAVIDEKEKRQTPNYPAYNIYPRSQWRYALKRLEPNEKAEIQYNEISKNPFWDEKAPFEITVKARKLQNWDLERIVNKKNVDEINGEGLDQRQIDCGATKVDEDFILTPKLPDQSFVHQNLGEETEIVLVPYGCTTARLTVFPKYIKDMINHFDFLADEKKKTEASKRKPPFFVFINPECPSAWDAPCREHGCRPIQYWSMRRSWRWFQSPR